MRDCLSTRFDQFFSRCCRDGPIWIERPFVVGRYVPGMAKFRGGGGGGGEMRFTVLVNAMDDSLSRGHDEYRRGDRLDGGHLEGCPQENNLFSNSRVHVNRAQVSRRENSP
jgi:hypothetical protein